MSPRSSQDIRGVPSGTGHDASPISPSRATFGQPEPLKPERKLSITESVSLSDDKEITSLQPVETPPTQEDNKSVDQAKSTENGAPARARFFSAIGAKSPVSSSLHPNSAITSFDSVRIGNTLRPEVVSGRDEAVKKISTVGELGLVALVGVRARAAQRRREGLSSVGSLPKVDEDDSIRGKEGAEPVAKGSLNGAEDSTEPVDPSSDTANDEERARELEEARRRRRLYEEYSKPSNDPFQTISPYLKGDQLQLMKEYFPDIDGKRKPSKSSKAESQAGEAAEQLAATETTKPQPLQSTFVIIGWFPNETKEPWEICVRIDYPSHFLPLVKLHITALRGWRSVLSFKSVQGGHLHHTTSILLTIFLDFGLYKCRTRRWAHVSHKTTEDENVTLAQFFDAVNRSYFPAGDENPDKTFFEASEHATKLEKWIKQRRRYRRDKDFLKRTDSTAWAGWVHGNLNNASELPFHSQLSIKLILKWSQKRIAIAALIPLLLSFGVGMWYMLTHKDGDETDAANARTIACRPHLPSK